MTQLSDMFDRLSGKESKPIGSESMNNLQRIVLLVLKNMLLLLNMKRKP